jgi:alkanesulfonate monooxygenase SsuD/methylene tetrahydromethanopterin reductase-like flavin-dependent oxidoreductase (luciferase family)
MSGIRNRHFEYRIERPILAGNTEGARVMRFGLFGSAAARRPASSDGGEFDSAEGYRDFIEYNIEAEALGFHGTFVVEHHFTGYGQVSATINLLTWLGARTKTLRLGTAVMVLPWHNPVLLAEQAATLDLLSGGRLDFGVGKGYRYNEFAGFCVPIDEADARFQECLDVIVKAWTSDRPFSHRGRYWQFDNIVVEPPAAQKPHPRIWMGAGSERSIRQVAERGFNLLLGQYASAADVRTAIATFKAEVETRGRRFDPMQVGVTRAFFVADSEAEKEAALQRRLANRVRQLKLATRPDGTVHGGPDRATGDPDKVNRTSAMYGSADDIAGRLDELRAAGVGYVLINGGGSGGGARGRTSLRRFAREVMPAFAGEPRMADAAK